MSDRTRAARPQLAAQIPSDFLRQLRRDLERGLDEWPCPLTLRQGLGDAAQRSPGRRRSIRGDRRTGAQQGVLWRPICFSARAASFPQ